MKKKYYWIIGIVIVIIFVFLFYWSAFLLSFKNNQRPPKLETAKSTACEELVTAGCNVSTNSITLKNYDANNDGKIDSTDTLFELCKNVFQVKTDSECKTKACGMVC